MPKSVCCSYRRRCTWNFHTRVQLHLSNVSSFTHHMEQRLSYLINAHFSLGSIKIFMVLMKSSMVRCGFDRKPHRVYYWKPCHIYFPRNNNHHVIVGSLSLSQGSPWDRKAPSGTASLSLSQGSLWDRRAQEGALREAEPTIGEIS